MHVGRVGVIRRRESKYSYTFSNAVRSAKAGSGRTSRRPTRGGAFKTTKRYGPCRPVGVSNRGAYATGVRGRVEVHTHRRAAVQ